MSLQTWADNGWLRPHRTSPQEIRQLFDIVARDIKDTRQTGLSADWRFGIAYNAALKLCTILLYAEGFKPEKTLAHYRTLRALPVIMGNRRDSDADYLDACRSKRNIVEYDYAGGASESEAEELYNFIRELKDDVINWLKSNHPELL